MSARTILLLGPQGDRQTVAQAVGDLGIDGPVATITAGWEEREGEDAELSEHLGGRARNLGLYPRAESVFREDPEVRDLLHERFDRSRELRTLYRMRLAPQLETCRALLALTDPAAPDPVHGPEIEDAIAGVRALDAHSLARARALDVEIDERMEAGKRASIGRHREELAGILGECRAVLIAGGHVGILLNRLRMFGVLELVPDKPVIAWSGGAMVLAQRVVLFHDSPPQGPGDAEIYGPGLGLVRGLVPLPHARHRLRLDDRARVSLFARRFAPDICAALDGGEKLAGDSGDGRWSLSANARVLQESGAVVQERAA